MKQKVIAIISVLKPIDDSRNYEKIGHSISQTNKYEINIIGFWTKNVPACNNIHFFPLFKFHRLHWKRLTTCWDIYKKLLQLKPDIIIVTTPEILIVISLYKILFGTKILYDVQENYYRNVRTSKHIHWFFRHSLAVSIRLIEKMCAPLVDHFILAEQIYANELSFTALKSTVVANKYKIIHPLEPINKTTRNLNFVYTGTIGDSYGIFEAIYFAKAAFAMDHTFHLTIAGYCADHKTYEKLQAITQGLSYIKILGGSSLLPHYEILKIIQNADYALLPYSFNNNLEGRIPTKMYEYIYFRIPMIIRPGSAWKVLGDQFNACYYFDFNFSKGIPLQGIRGKNYYNQGDVQDILWQKEESKLLNVVNGLI